MSNVQIEAGEDFFANPEKQPRPYVQFKMKSGEVRDKEGGRTFVDVPWAHVTPAGGKDRIEKPVTDWLRDLKQHAEAGRIPPMWPHQYEQAFQAWLKGEEMPLHGYSIKLWTALSPAQQETVLAAKIFTVEDLADCNEEAIGRMGMGAINLRRMAQTWVADRKGAGDLAARLEAAIQGRLEAEARVKVLEDQVAALEAKLPKVEPPQRPSGAIDLKS